MTPGIELFSEEGDKEALEESKKRKTPFNFALVGLKPGTVLQSVFDDTIICVIADDRRVTFRDQDHSLSSSALIIAHEKGYGWSTIAGPEYWKYEGKTLSDLRDDKVSAEEEQ